MHKVEFSRLAEQPDKALIGMSAKMSVASDATPALWQRFMPRRNEIRNRVGKLYYSVQNFSELDGFESFTPATVFEKWAAVEVDPDDVFIPELMQRFVLRGGHYAVFDHYGPPREFPRTLRFIFSEWLPHSGWELDAREHFEVLQPNWRADDPQAHEEVWIPLRS